MSIVLWPRQEVLQLVIPQLGSVGRHLNANTANNLIRRLTKLQSPEGKISFDRWLVVAKEVLRWNDHCIHLFWDMVSLSTYYLSRDSSLTINREDVSLDLEYVAIFLVLHLHDGTTPSGGSSAAHHSKTPSSPTVAYEDVWPTAPTSPTDHDASSPSTSPNKDSDRQHRKMSPMSGTPMSPRSPKANSSPAHKRAAAASMASGSRTPRSHAQYLHSVRQKIPLILRSLSMDQQDESTLTDLTMSIDTPGNIRNNGSEGGAGVQYSSINPTVDFAIAKKTVDALGLIVCGGYSRDQAVPHLSALFPVLNGGEHDSATRSKEAFQDPDVLPTIAFSELSAWINVHMSMNDTLYPVSVSPSYGSIPCSPTSRDMPHISAMNATDADTAGKDSPSNASSKAQQPSRTVNTVSSLSRSKPTIINGCSTTVIHVIGSLMTAKSSFRKYRSMSFDREMSASGSAHDLRANSTSARLEHVLSDSDSDKTSPLGPTRPRNHSDTSQEEPHGLFDEMSRNNTEDIEMWMRNNNNYLSKPETMLPPLYLNVCTRAKLYLISPYHSATITGCSDCEIVIGAVFGAVIVSNCERVKITVACRKLLVLNCLDCAFNVATLTTTIIAGDCRSLVVGPYNTSYKNLRNHLKLAALEPLMSSEDPSANPTIPAALSAAAASVEHTHPHGHHEMHRTLSQQVNGKGSASPNCWASLCDVSACLEAATTSSSPSGYAIDAMDDACPLLPPLPSTARLLPYENFRSVSIPFKAETIAFEACPIRTPLEYLDSLKQHRETLSHIKAQVASVLLTAPSGSSVPPAPSTSPASSISANNALSPEERKRKQIVASTAVSKKFMEWLVSTGNAKQVLDLIRIDGEKMGIHGQNNNGHS